MVAQILKPSQVTYEFEAPNNFEVTLGVPQGSSISPALFTLTLDYILQNDRNIKSWIEEGVIQAFADDLAIAINPDEQWKVKHLIEVLERNNLKVNKSK